MTRLRSKARSSATATESARPSAMQMEAHQKRWVDSRRVDEKELQKSLFPIPEPVHRLPAGRIGISLRARRRASLETLRETCWFYQQKCAGKYDCKSLAARYLFELAREVQEQVEDLERVLGEREDRTQYLEACMREWDETFGPVRSLDSQFVADAEGLRMEDGQRVLSSTIETRSGLGKQLDSLQIVSPVRLKALIDEYVERICKLDAELRTERSNYAAREEKFASEMADYARVVRSQASSEIERLQASNKATLLEVESHYEAKVASLEADLKTQDRSNGGFHKKVKDLESSISAAKQETETVRKQKRRIAQELRAQKELADNNWAGLLEKAQRQVDQKYLQKLNQMQQRLNTMHLQCEEIRARGERELATYKTNVVKPMESKLEQQEKTSQRLRTENEYLRGRVQELNKLLAAFQVAIQQS